jgi:hypothetical protein
MRPLTPPSPGAAEGGDQKDVMNMRVVSSTASVRRRSTRRLLWILPGISFLGGAGGRYLPPPRRGEGGAFAG